MPDRDEPNLTEMWAVQEIVSASRAWQAQQEEFAQWFAAIMMPALVKIDDAASEMTALLVSAGIAMVDWLDQHLPDNWPREGHLNNAMVVLGEGIPLVFVPRLETVRAVLAANDYDDRMAVICKNRKAIVEDCREVLQRSVVHPVVTPQEPLVLESITLLDREFFAGAQSLAVVASDTLLHNLVRDQLKRRNRYGLIINRIKDSDFDDEVFELALALKPVFSFLAPWWPGDEVKGPLSRHQSVHGASAEHFSEANATLAVMLATSLLLGFSMGEHWIDANTEEVGGGLP
jgi:hypothetical protein